MPVPKRKVSKSRRDKRQANKGITPQIVSACGNCTEPILPHQACATCGFYKGKKVLTTKAERMAQRVTKRTAAQAKAAQKNDANQQPQ